MLTGLVDEEERALLDLHTELSPLCEQLRRSLARGKRLRAATLLRETMAGEFLEVRPGNGSSP